MTAQHDLVVIGGGPGGYVAAIRAAQLGLNVACIDENELLGGSCLRVGCIPSKALLESSARLAEVREGLTPHGIRVQGVDFDLGTMMARKNDVVRSFARGIDSLLKRRRVTRYLGRGRLDGHGRVVVERDGQRTAIEAAKVLVAVGSRPASIPGVELDGDRIGTSTEALAYTEVPKRLVVIGAGYIGLELGSVWRRLGAEVVMLEATGRILPGGDGELSRQARPIFEKQGLQLRLNTRVQRAYVQEGRCLVECEGSEPIACDRVLVAVGRRPNTEDLGLDTVGVEPDRRGQIPVDDRYATAAQGVYAIGDCIAGPMLAHKASHEAIACVERMATGYGHVNYDAIPAVVYTHPEMASVGKTEEQLQQEGRPYRQGTFPFRVSGRARTLGELEGGVRILADEKTDRVLGVHILGPRAGDLIAEAAAAMEFGASSEDIARCCHAHPTLSEALGEAALAVDRRAIHLA